MYRNPMDRSQWFSKILIFLSRNILISSMLRQIYEFLMFILEFSSAFCSPLLDRDTIYCLVISGIIHLPLASWYLQALLVVCSHAAFCLSRRQLVLPLLFFFSLFAPSIEHKLPLMLFIHSYHVRFLSTSYHRVFIDLYFFQ